jgi:hypothetical protein
MGKGWNCLGSISLGPSIGLSRLRHKSFVDDYYTFAVCAIPRVPDAGRERFTNEDTRQAPAGETHVREFSSYQVENRPSAFLDWFIKYIDPWGKGFEVEAGDGLAIGQHMIVQGSMR